MSLNMGDKISLGYLAWRRAASCFGASQRASETNARNARQTEGGGEGHFSIHSGSGERFALEKTYHHIRKGHWVLFVVVFLLILIWILFEFGFDKKVVKYGDDEAVHPADVADEAQRVAGQHHYVSVTKIKLSPYQTKDIAALKLPQIWEWEEFIFNWSRLTFDNQ